MLDEARERSLNASLATLPSDDLSAFGLPLTSTPAPAAAGATLAAAVVQPPAGASHATMQTHTDPAQPLQHSVVAEGQRDAAAVSTEADTAGVNASQDLDSAPAAAQPHLH